MAEAPPTYTREEMDAILKRAIERQQAKSEEIPHEDLVAAAGEVGIPREEVEAAARDLEAERRKREGDSTEAAPPPATTPLAPGIGRQLRQTPAERAISCFALVMFAVFIQHETGAGWPIWAVLGVVLAAMFASPSVMVGFVGITPGARTAPRVSRRERRHQRREERLADFEQKVAIGADAIMRIIDEAKGMKARLEADLRPREAHREPREQGPRVLVTPPPVRVGIDAREADEVAREHREDAGERQRTRRG